MKHEFDFPYTYSGLLDDVMAKYGNHRMDGKVFFQRMIAKNLFFGGGIYINDGYLLNHPLARYYLQNESSLLSSMLRYGFIKILTRERDSDALSKMPGKMARQKNASFQQLVRSTEWRRGFREKWYDLSEWAFETGNAVAWPRRDMSYGYCKLMLRALNSRPEDIGVNLPETILLRICEDFFARRPLQSGPRDKLEKAAKAVIDEHLPPSRRMPALRSIMDIANQAYHYNFGLCLTSEIGTRNTTTSKGGGAICVDTTIGKAFDELLLEEEINEHVLKNIPLFGIPADFHFEDGEVFEPLVKPGSRAYGAKVRFARTIQSAILSPPKEKQNTTDLRDQVEDAMMSYVAAMVRELPFEVDEKVFFEDSDRLAVKTQPSVITAGNGSFVGSGNACMSQAIALGSKKHGIEFLVKKGVLSEAEPLNLHEVRPQISSLLFDMDKATDFVSDIPSF